MRSSKCAVLVFVSFVPVLVGCPVSDDIFQVSDVGISRQDTVLPGGVIPGTDVGPIARNDFGEGTEDTTPEGQCTTPADCNLDASTCQIVRCQQGECVVDNLDDGGACDDGDPCTVTECVAGTCITSGKTTCLDDNNPCTAEACVTGIGCTSQQTNNTPCDDGDECTGEDKCSEGVCRPGVKICDIGTADNPANNCLEIKTSEPASASGIYYVKTTAGATTTIYCDMTNNGGGWMRIAAIDGTVPLCNLTAGLGTVVGVQNLTGTAVLPAATAATLQIESDELMFVLPKGVMTFRSTHADWNWAAIAGGTINAGNSATYNVQVSINGGAYEVLKSNVSPAGAKGPSMLGGQRADSKYTVVLGTGAAGTGTFAQDTKCAGQVNKGLWGGNIFPGTGLWSSTGTIYIR